jgi:hypothetical protein
MKIFLAAVAIVGAVVVGAVPALAGTRAYCDGYARDYANHNAHPVASTGVGAAVGAGIGCAVGAVLGGKCGTGAAIGAGGGAVAGAANASGKWQRFYDSAFYQCMNGAPAAYVAPQPVYVLPPVGSKAWKAQCAQKYGSFDWYSGTFQPSGYPPPPRRTCTLP